MKTKIWQTIADENVHQIWVCKNKTCLRKNIKVCLYPIIPDPDKLYPIPTCDKCKLELTYQKTEVLI